MSDTALQHADSKITVFVVDDDHSVRRSLSRLLRSFGFNVETYTTGEEFLSREPYQGTGCLILDIRMPGLSGMDLHDQLIRTGHTLPVVFITGHGDIPMSVRAMKKGAVDFLPKPFDESELLKAINRALEASKTSAEEQAERNRVMTLFKRLTPREREIVPYVTHGMLNKQIAFALKISEKTVKVHRGRIMEKLGSHSVADLIQLAEKAGIQR